MDRGHVPLAGDNIVDRAADLLAAHHGARAAAARCTSPRRSRSPAGWPAARPTPPPRWSRWTGSGSCEHLRRRPARAGRAARQRRAVRAGRRHRARHRSRRDRRRRSTDRGTWWWVVVPVRRSGCRRRRSTGTSTSCSPTPRPSRPCPSALLAALAAGDPHALAAALHNDLQAAALDLRPDLAQLIERGRGRGRAARRGHRLRPDLRLPLRVRRPRPRRRPPSCAPRTTSYSSPTARSPERTLVSYG